MAKVVVNEGKTFIEDIWDIDDMRQVANELEQEFTDEMIINAMGHVVANYDANHGITWDIVEEALKFELVVQEQNNG